MTAVNFVVSRSQIFVATDSLVTDGKSITYASKTLLLPHLRVLVAGMGSHYVSFAVKSMLWTMPLPDADVDDLAPLIPEFVRKNLGVAREHTPDSHSIIFLFGFARSGAPRAVRLSSSDDFEPRRLAPGTYLSPAPKAWECKPIERNATGEWGLPESSDPTQLVKPSPERRLDSWVQDVRSTIAAVSLQAAESPNRIGGRVLCTHLTEDMATQSWCEIPALEP